MLAEEFSADEPGGSVLVKKGDKTVFLRSYGLADLGTKEKITENWAGASDPFIGYSWFIGEKQFLDEENKTGVNVIYHNGDQGGFRAFYIVIPEKDILYIGLFNRPPEDLDKIIKEGIYLLERTNG